MKNDQFVDQYKKAIMYLTNLTSGHFDFFHCFRNIPTLRWITEVSLSKYPMISLGQIMERNWLLQDFKALANCSEFLQVGRVLTRNILKKERAASLVAQWLRICLLMKGTRVRALVWEDPTCRGATGPVSHSYWACASGACAPQQERPR